MAFLLRSLRYPPGLPALSPPEWELGDLSELESRGLEPSFRVEMKTGWGEGYEWGGEGYGLDGGEGYGVSMHGDEGLTCKGEINVSL